MKVFGGSRMSPSITVTNNTDSDVYIKQPLCIEAIVNPSSIIQ